jgi:general secretion pathway protein I
MRAKGFTLLEVLIALAIVALALTALVRASGQQADALAREREQTLAGWTAANVLTGARLREGFPTIGERTGDEQQGDRRFRWRLVVSGTDQPAIRRLTVTVFGGEHGDEPVASLSGFAGQR